MTAERARNSVELLLRDQHDLKSGLFDIGLRVELLAESPEENLNQTLKKIAARISGFGTSFEKSQFRSLSVLRGLTTPELASVTSAIAHAQRALSDSSSIEVIVGSIAPGTSVVFGGGTEGLGLLLTHLFENALGGDGRTGARHMWIGIVPESVGVVLTLEDDGPGFPPEQLKDLGSGPTRLGAKPHSSGLGLWLASRAVEAAGGRIQFDNRSVGGARIEITLAYAETEVPPPPQTKLRPASV